jgi:hypothetical protein
MHTAGPHPGGVLDKYRMTRTVPAVIAFLLTLCGALWSDTTRAGRASASFGVTVRVLPHCDDARLGGLMKAPGGRFVCVYPKIRKLIGQGTDSGISRLLRNEQDVHDGVHAIRTIEY